MAKADIKSYNFSETGIKTLGEDTREVNWPVIYQIYNDSTIYIGETTNLKHRMSQHFVTKAAEAYTKFSVVFDETYNKSVALDLESQLIQWFNGDGAYITSNRNAGIADREYYGRSNYRTRFPAIWEQLRNLGVAHKSIQEIENSGLFKFSPYKRLNEDQLRVVYEVLIDLDEAFKYDKSSLSIIGGSEGTGKTIVIMYLIKLIRDIQDQGLRADDEEDSDQDFEMFFKEPFSSRLKNKRLALVVPNSSLKGSIGKVFRSVSNLKNHIDILSPMDFGSNGKVYDVTFVDEAHLFKTSNKEVQKANRQKVDIINETLFGDNKIHTELDWIIKKSKNVVMVYGDQRIRQNNITKESLQTYAFREHILKSQMRSLGGTLYIDYLKQLLSDTPPLQKQSFADFEFELFENFKPFVEAIKKKQAESGLSRLVAGFAWKWKSKRQKDLYDIEIEGMGLRWNSTTNDWVGSSKSIDEVGSIYTIQGYDLNYCGVIIGNDLKYDPTARKIIFSKKDYFDAGAKKRSNQQIEANIELTDNELLDQVTRTYRILMNRSVKGTYVYVCDSHLREYLSKYVTVIN